MCVDAETTVGRLLDRAAAKWFIPNSNDTTLDTSRRLYLFLDGESEPLPYSPTLRELAVDGTAFSGATLHLRRGL